MTENDKNVFLDKYCDVYKKFNLNLNDLDLYSKHLFSLTNIVNETIN